MRMTGYYLTLLLCVGVLSGCVSSNGTTQEAKHYPELDYEFIGIPLLAFGSGTSVPLTPELSITAAHVARFGYDKVVAYHPHCDIAIIETDNNSDDISLTGKVFSGESVTTFGMDLFGGMLTSQGLYHLDLNFVNEDDYSTCPASVMDAPIEAGMSGGGVYNRDSELVGIITAFASKEGTKLLNGDPLEIDRLSIFVSTLYLEPWVEETLNDYYHDDANIALPDGVAINN